VRSKLQSKTTICALLSRPCSAAGWIRAVWFMTRILARPRLGVMRGKPATQQQHHQGDHRQRQHEAHHHAREGAQLA
jgi:hypothetical protein